MVEFLIVACTSRAERVLPGVILIFAAAVKLLVEWTILTVGLGLAELFLGIALVANIFPKTARVLGIILFSCFLIALFQKVARSEVSCGCFGSFSVAPIFALVLDIVVLVGFFATPSHSNHSTPSRFSLGYICSIFLLVAIMIAVGRRNEFRSTFSVDAIINSNALKPTEWIGKRLPLLPMIEYSEFLEIGEWELIFFDEHCSICREFVGSRTQEDFLSERIAILRFPNSLEDDSAPPLDLEKIPRAIFFDLRTVREFVFQPPVHLRLRDGVVLSSERE